MVLVAADIDTAERLAAVELPVDKSVDTAPVLVSVEKCSTVVVGTDIAAGIARPADSDRRMVAVAGGNSEPAAATGAVKLTGNASASAGPKSFLSSMSNTHRSMGTD